MVWSKGGTEAYIRAYLILLMPRIRTGTILCHFLMAYRSTPNTTTGFSSYYLLHGREMVVPNSNDLKAKIPTENSGHDSRLENLKSSLRLAYKLVKKANKKSHLKKKRLYDRKANLRSFQTGDIVYLYNPAKMRRKCFKFHKYWTGPFHITAKLSDLNYEIISMNNKTQVVHVNRLKISYNPEIWKSKQKPKNPRIRTEKKRPNWDAVEENEALIGSRPLLKTRPPLERLEPRTPPSLTPCTPDSVQQAVDTPYFESADPNYEPPRTPRSRREL